MSEQQTPFTPRVHTTDSAPKFDGLMETQMELDFDSDEPLACPIGKVDGEACESCQ